MRISLGYLHEHTESFCITPRILGVDGYGFLLAAEGQDQRVAHAPSTVHQPIANGFSTQSLVSGGQTHILSTLCPHGLNFTLL